MREGCHSLREIVFFSVNLLNLLIVFTSLWLLHRGYFFHASGFPMRFCCAPSWIYMTHKQSHVLGLPHKETLLPSRNSARVVSVSPWNALQPLVNMKRNYTQVHFSLMYIKFRGIIPEYSTLTMIVSADPL